ncbi:Bifunctional inhibitor/lipid-transfer protein/seed storage 2S albumin superfamily protein [Thalictrum thalictroides]|uniref:Bifunctional inhibitor/lipid-transfer protein/seed storage 2S albumin superfamily protein n=1 Tax=Thalictrum thalictroides TaxID=46969 RepID=A0A7J6W966_THATH|nr:Bifunctional inhibitor/lipid-transfer protein/seed storage 2S albumin superfamily protein [Thalictrum thalictroides]
MLWAGARAQSGCTTALISLSPCLTFINGNSSTPSSSCCSQLANVVRSQPRCLCAIVNGGGASLGITINQTQALALPGSCNVQTPPVSRCNAATSPTAPPEDSPADSPADGPSANDTPLGHGSKTMPTTGGGMASAEIPLCLGFSLLLIASGVSTLTSF